MCVIAFTDKRGLTHSEFNNCWDTNPDGFGMAWRTVKDGVTRIHVRKGIMKRDEAWLAYKPLVNERVALHFRIKTAGAVCPALTHPFLVTKDSPTVLKYNTENNVLFHNGCLHGWQEECMDFMLNNKNSLKGEMSDSRWLAIKMANLKSMKKAREYLTKQTGKYLLMDKNIVYLYGDFIDHKGVSFSNSSFNDYVPVKARYNKYDKGRWEEWGSKQGLIKTDANSKELKLERKKYEEEYMGYGDYMNDPLYHD